MRALQRPPHTHVVSAGTDTRFALSTDVVIFTLREDTLAVPLVRRDSEPYVGHWSLPGGMVAADEDLDSAARRQLATETGIEGVYLEQLYSFGQPDRDPRARVVSVAYFALVPIGQVQIDARAAHGRVDWFAVDALPPLAFDHRDIVHMARQRLIAKLEYSTIALQFMPRQFTLSELQNVYEILLGQPLDKRNFRKRVLASGHIEDTGRTRQDGAHRPARLYRAKRPRRVDIFK